MALSMAICPWLSGAIIVSGVVSAALLSAGLTHTDAATASLLATALLFLLP
jgi:hypothetical protein